MRRFWRRSGNGNSIFRSKRPGRRRAGSKVSARLVAMITWGGGGDVGATARRPWTSQHPREPHLDVDVLVEAVHLVEELQEDALDLPVSCGGVGTPVGGG